MKHWIFALFLSAFAAHAQQTVPLAMTAPSTGACYFANWIQTGSDWYVDGASGYYSVNSSDAVVFGSTEDKFTITNNTGTTGQIYDVTKRLYVEPSGSSLIASKTAYTWDFLIASSCPNTGGGTTPPPPPPPSGTLTVMPIGDSETWGLDTEASEVQAGYRCAFYWNEISQLGATIDMVGTSNDVGNVTSTYVYPVNVGNSWPGCPSNAQGWSGYGGLQIAGIVSGAVVPGTNYNYAGALGDVAAFQPDVIIFQGGTNDIGLASNPATVNVTSDLTNGLNQMLAASPNSLIVVASIPPFVPGGTDVTTAMVNQVPVVNAEIAAVVSSFQSAGKNVILDTSYVGVPATITNFPDDWGHPSAGLYITHANSLASQLYPYLHAMATAQDKVAAVRAKIKTAVTLESMH